MGNLTLNQDLTINIQDYDETKQAEMTNRLLPGHESHLTEWHGYGTIAGVRARATYMTTGEDEAQVRGNGGDWGDIDWWARMSRVDLLTDDDVVIATIDNPDFEA